MVVAAAKCVVEHGSVSERRVRAKGKIGRTGIHGIRWHKSIHIIFDLFDLVWFGLVWSGL